MQQRGLVGTLCSWINQSENEYAEIEIDARNKQIEGLKSVREKLSTFSLDSFNHSEKALSLSSVKAIDHRHSKTIDEMK